MRQITRYEIAPPFPDCRIAVLTDIHNRSVDDVLDALNGVQLILLPGDLMNRHQEGYEAVKAVLAQLPRIAPTYMSLGNHETNCAARGDILPLIRRSAVRLLDNQYIRLKNGMVLGGLSERPNLGFLKKMAAQPGYKLLMCHRPEYYFKYVQAFDIQLTLSGHAHGGQVCLFGHGLFAPGQGLLPKYTAGFYDNARLLVSRGMTNSARAPRINNPCEMLLLTQKGAAHTK